MNRWPLLGLATIAACSVATAQSHDATAESEPLRALRAEAYGASCGLNLRPDDRAAPGRVALRVDGAVPGRQLALVLGTTQADHPLAARCRLYTVPQLSIPIAGDAAGPALVSVPVPDSLQDLLHVQAVQLDDESDVLASNGLAIRMSPRGRRSARLLAAAVQGDARYEFLATAPDEVLVIATSDSPLPPMPDEEFDPVELYERVANAPAPQALRRVAAAARSAAAQGPQLEGSESPETSDGKPGQAPDGASCLSASWFVNTYCQSTSGWSYCYVDNYGNPWAGSYCSWILGATACVSGGYWFDYLRWEGGSWVLKDDVYLTSCQHWWMGISGSWKSRRIRVDFGSGDRKHFSCKGN